LCTEQQVSELLDMFDTESRDTAKCDAVNQFCRFLIDASVVTEWQCEKLKAGKWKGFYLDEYVLLEQVGKDRTTSSYRARDVRDGTRVCLVITPTTLAPYIQYGWNDLSKINFPTH
jgi:hypothetical protein